MTLSSNLGILDECSVALSGSFPGHTQASLTKSIEDLGGYLMNTISRFCTHLIVSEKHWDGGVPKVKRAAEFPGIKIVGLDWLLETIRTQRKVDEHLYLMGKSDGTAAVNDKSDGKGQKRTRDGNVTAKSPAPEEEPPLKKQKDGQEANPKTIHVPVDEGCQNPDNYEVFIAPDGTIFDASLNQTNAGSNVNKFFRVQVLSSTVNKGTYAFTRFGRVGQRGQSALLGDGSPEEALTIFEKKFKKKSGHMWAHRLGPLKKGKYAFIEQNYEEDSEVGEDDLPGAGTRRGSKASTKGESKRKAVESALPKPVQELMQLIFNQEFFTAAMAAMEYDSNKLPLGKLSKRTLRSGYEALKELAELLSNRDSAEEVHNNMTFTQAIQEVSNSYYSNIPHNFGRDRAPVIGNTTILMKEVELLESLSDMSIAEEIMKLAKADVQSAIHPIDRQYAGLGLTETVPLEPDSVEFKELRDYFVKTHGATHAVKYRVDEIFRIERNGEDDRFSKSPYAKLEGDRRLLWHGSRTTNFGGILSQGLRIAPPEAPANGYMFGKGVYLADMSSKSANYCQVRQSEGIGLLLLCEAELGKSMLKLPYADPQAAEKAKEKGCCATWGQGLIGPGGWKDAGCVSKELEGVMMPDTERPLVCTDVRESTLAYNEYVCYDVAQIRLRYLFRVKMD